MYLYLCCVSVYECVGGKVGDMYWYIYLRGSECLTSLTCNVFLHTCVRISMYSNSEHVRVGQAYINHYLLNVSLRVTSLPVLTLALYTFQCQINPALRPWHRKVVNVYRGTVALWGFCIGALSWERVPRLDPFGTLLHPGHQYNFLGAISRVWPFEGKS